MHAYDSLCIQRGVRWEWSTAVDGPRGDVIPDLTALTG